MSNNIFKFYHTGNGNEEDVMYGKVCNSHCGDKWFFILPYREAAGFMKKPCLVDDNRSAIGYAIQDYISSKTIAGWIANDYMTRNILQEIVRNAEECKDGKILLEDMKPGKLYKFSDGGGYCDLIVACILAKKIYFMWLNGENEDFTLTGDPSNIAECWPLEYLQEKVINADGDDNVYLQDARTLFGMYDFAGSQIHNLAEGLVDFDKREELPFAEVINRFSFDVEAMKMIVEYESAKDRLDIELYKLCCADDNKYKTCIVNEFGWVNDKDFYVWVSYLYLGEFTAILKSLFGNILFDNGCFNANIQPQGVCIDLSEMLGDCLDLETIFPKDKYQH